MNKLFFLLAILVFQILTLASQAKAGEVFFEKDRSLPLVRVNVVFKGGSVTDPDHKNGATDIMGRLMLRGTKSKTKNQINLALDNLGARLAVNNHLEYLSFSGSVLSENLKPFLELLAEIITAPSFRGVELDKLKKEQMSQLADELGQDRSLVKLRFDQAFFKGHPFSKSAQGRVSDIKNLQLGDIQNQYQKLIRDSQMIILGAGDADESDLSVLTKAIMEKRNVGGSTLTAVPEFKNYPTKLKVVIFDKPDRTQTQVQLGQRGISIHSPLVDALDLANYAFGGGTFQSRLMVELRVKRGWTYGAGSSMKFATQPSVWKVGFFPKNADTPPAIAEALKLVRTLRDHGLTQAEFDSAKQSMVNGAGFSYNTPDKRLDNTLQEKIYGLPEGYYKNSAERITALTLDQVNQALKQFLTPDQMMIGLVATASLSKADIAKALGLKESDIEVQDYLAD